MYLSNDVYQLVSLFLFTYLLETLRGSAKLYAYETYLLGGQISNTPPKVPFSKNFTVFWKKVAQNAIKPISKTGLKMFEKISKKNFHLFF